MQRKDDPGGLGPWFDAARAGTTAPDAAFLARLVTQAEAMQPPAPVRAPAPAPAPGAVVRLWRAVAGGWPALAGLTAAVVAGFWIGYAPPAPVGNLLSSAAAPVIGSGIYGEEDFLALLGG
ncbi:MAG: hypothetical protein IT542_07670 [Rubellimicrobium sp.]|nr:hypothetical protein [Rubellimicrobium sp.]